MSPFGARPPGAPVALVLVLGAPTGVQLGAILGAGLMPRLGVPASAVCASPWRPPPC